MGVEILRSNLVEMQGIMRPWRESESRKTQRIILAYKATQLSSAWDLDAARRRPIILLAITVPTTARLSSIEILVYLSDHEGEAIGTQYYPTIHDVRSDMGQDPIGHWH